MSWVLGNQRAAVRSCSCGQRGAFLSPGRRSKIGEFHLLNIDLSVLSYPDSSVWPILPPEAAGTTREGCDVPSSSQRTDARSCSRRCVGSTGRQAIGDRRDSKHLAVHSPAVVTTRIDNEVTFPLPSTEGAFRGRPPAEAMISSRLGPRLGGLGIEVPVPCSRRPSVSQSCGRSLFSQCPSSPPVHSPRLIHPDKQLPACLSIPRSDIPPPSQLARPPRS